MTLNTLNQQQAQVQISQILSFYIRLRHFFQLNQPLLRVHDRAFSSAEIFTNLLVLYVRDYFKNAM